MLSGMPAGCTTISVVTSSSMASPVSGRLRTSKPCCNCSITTQGGVGCDVIMSKPPLICSPETTPTTGFFAATRPASILLSSYSRNSSRSGWKNGITWCSPQALLPASPKYTCSPPASSGTACRPNSAAWSSASEKATGSITCSRMRPSARSAYSSSSSRTRRA